MTLSPRIVTGVALASCLALVLMPRQVLANDMQRILHWALNTAPPFHIVDGSYANQGICDSLMLAVEDALPAYRVQRSLMPQTRIGVLFERSINQCFPCMIYRPNEAEDSVYMSQPTHVYEPHGIITTPELAERMREQFGDPVALHLLLESNDYRFGHPAGRRYGELQPLLDLHEGDNSYRVLRTGEHATVAILEMIEAGRIHYTIDYHALLRFHQRTGQGELAFVAIAENQGREVQGAIGCTNNAWGRQVIADIDRNMRRIRQDARFLQSLELWFDGKASLDVD